MDRSSKISLFGYFLKYVVYTQEKCKANKEEPCDKSN